MNDTSASNQTSQSLGERLRAAREGKELKQEDLAGLLHLQVNIIQSLENNQFDQLAAPTYVKGYIRSIARHLDLDGDELVQIYETGEPVGHGSPEILPQVTKHTQFSSTDKPVKIMTYLISFGLVLLLLIWWQSEFIVNTVQTDPEIQAQSYGGPYAGGFIYTYDNVFHPDEPFYRAVPDGETENEITGLVEEMPEIAAPMPDAEMNGDQPAVEENIQTEDEETVTESIESPFPDAILVLEISKESWIEIRDGDGERLYLNLAKSGEVINLSGKLPISVVLGNAEGVKVNWKGQAFDLAPHSNAGVARFKLEE